MQNGIVPRRNIYKHIRTKTAAHTCRFKKARGTFGRTAEYNAHVWQCA